MLQGRFRDVVSDAGGARIAASPWRPNLVVDGAFRLLASLLKRDPAMRGILYWAVGEGDAEWDGGQPATVSRTSRLTSEVLRLEVPREAIAYVDRHGRESGGPETDLDVRLTFEWPDEHVTLREFGVFGGDAAGRPNSGVMINHVIHRRIDLAPGQRLSRQLRLSFGRAADRRWLDVAPHWLGDSPARVVDGVGDVYASALAGIGISTVHVLAETRLAPGEGHLPRIPLVEFRAKARLALRTAAEIHPPERMHDLTVSHVLRHPVATLAADIGVPEPEVFRLREQLATLELAINHAYLAPVTVGTLAGAGP